MCSGGAGGNPSGEWLPDRLHAAIQFASHDGKGASRASKIIDTLWTSP